MLSNFSFQLSAFQLLPCRIWYFRKMERTFADVI
jgi:hypothetical protein